MRTDVIVDEHAIDDVLAARLATCLLGHILYLKSQVPFPVAQLSNIPRSVKGDKRTLKKREDLIYSIDLLSSHLVTTFTALSTAFARSKAPFDVAPKVHLVYILGPSPNAAKARVVLELEDLTMKVWGERDDVSANSPVPPDLVAEEDEVATQPPSSPSPSEGSDTDEESESESESESDGSCQSSRSGDDEPPAPVSPPALAFPRLDESRLRLAERELSRALAQTNANEDHDRGLAEDIAPTQMQLYLHAPRRFVHPSWVPKQTLQRALDSVLLDVNPPPPVKEALESVEGPQATPRKAPKRKGVQTEVVGIRCRAKPTDTLEAPATPTTQPDENAEALPLEEDELIWWCWEGKLVGFSDL